MILTSTITATASLQQTSLFSLEILTLPQKVVINNI